MITSLTNGRGGDGGRGRGQEEEGEFLLVSYPTGPKAQKGRAAAAAN